jgi:type I restriction enzyme S subunit
VVIVQTGDIGQCAVIPDDFGEANCHALLIARTNESVASGEYLAAYLQSNFGRHSLLRLATGALHPHLEFGIRDAALLLPPKAMQSEIVHVVRDEQRLLDATSAIVGRQIGLLDEHRQALITAAVTGEFVVAGSCGVGGVKPPS